jgi:hypothetical protein
LYGYYQLEIDGIFQFITNIQTLSFSWKIGGKAQTILKSDCKETKNNKMVFVKTRENSNDKFPERV